MKRRVLFAVALSFVISIFALWDNVRPARAPRAALRAALAVPATLVISLVIALAAGCGVEGEGVGSQPAAPPQTEPTYMPGFLGTPIGPPGLVPPLPPTPPPTPTQGPHFGYTPTAEDMRRGAASGEERKKTWTAVSGPTTAGALILIAGREVQLPADAYIDGFVAKIEFGPDVRPYGFDAPLIEIKRGNSKIVVALYTGVTWNESIAPGETGAFAFLFAALNAPEKPRPLFGGGTR